MFSSLVLVKEFFSHWVGITVSAIVLAVLAYAGIEHYEVKHLSSQIVTLNQQLGAVKANDAQWQGAASDCSAGTAAIAASSAAVTEAASEAVATATVKASKLEAHGKAILARKPTSTDDYTASKQLMNDLIDNRQAQLKGAQ